MNKLHQNLVLIPIRHVPYFPHIGNFTSFLTSRRRRRLSNALWTTRRGERDDQNRNQSLEHKLSASEFNWHIGWMRGADPVCWPWWCGIGKNLHWSALGGAMHFQHDQSTTDQRVERSNGNRLQTKYARTSSYSVTLQVCLPSRTLFMMSIIIYNFHCEKTGP